MMPHSIAPGDRHVPWLGQCRPDWQFGPIKYLCRVNAEVLPEGTNPETEIRYMDIGSVGSDGTWTASEPMLFGEAPSRARRVLVDGDVLVSTVRTYLRAIAHVEKVAEGLICSTGFAVISAGEEVDSRFLAYWVRSAHFVDEIMARSVGVNYPAINASDIGNLPFPLITLGDQRDVADFLDRETGRIDGLVARKQRQIELLHERGAALISRAVTKGQDPDARMKDSGIEWLGEIPAHWETPRAKVLFREVDDRSETGEEELLSVSHITGVTLRSQKNVTMFMAESLEGYKKCSAGDLAINTMWAWMGAMGIAPVSGIVSPSYNVYRLHRSDCDEWFFDQLFRTGRFIAEVVRHSKGIWTSRLRLYPEAFYEIRLPTPPVEEQRAIVAAIRRETGDYDALRKKVEMSIEKLQEYRSSLITAAVTGQIDVRKEAA